MALGMMMPGMWSGWLQDQVGYLKFFTIVIAATLPSFLVTAFPLLDADFGRKKVEKRRAVSRRTPSTASTIFFGHAQRERVAVFAGRARSASPFVRGPRLRCGHVARASTPPRSISASAAGAAHLGRHVRRREEFERVPGFVALDAHDCVLGQASVRPTATNTWPRNRAGSRCRARGPEPLVSTSSRPPVAEHLDER